MNPTTRGTFASGTGHVQTYAITPSPLNADWSHTIPDRTRAVLISGHAILTTAALGLNRSVQLYIASGANIIARSANYNLQPSSRVQPYTMIPANEIQTGIATYDYILATPPRLTLAAGDRVYVITTSKRVGDTWSAITLRFLEWMEP